MGIKLHEVVKDDFHESCGPSTVTHVFLSVWGIYIDLGKFYEGPGGSEETSKRLHKIREFGKTCEEIFDKKYGDQARLELCEELLLKLSNEFLQKRGDGKFFSTASSYQELLAVEINAYFNFLNLSPGKRTCKHGPCEKCRKAFV